MHMFLGIIYLSHCLIYLHAASQDTKDSSHLPKLGPTMVANPFNVDDDVKTLIHETEAAAMSAKVIIDVLTSHTYSQRMQIIDGFTKSKGDFHQTLQFKEKRTPIYELEPLLSQFLLSSADKILKTSIEESLDQSHDWGYMSILCTSAETRLKALNDYKYLDFYNRNPGFSLHDKINKRLEQKNGKKFLYTLIDPKPHLRPESGVDLTKVKDQLTYLPHDKDGCKITNNNLLMLMTKESFDQIKAVDDEYRKQNKGASIVMAIDDNCYGDLKEGYRRIVNYAVDPFGYYAEEFNMALTDPNRGWIQAGADIVVFTRCEIDLKDIDEAHQKKFNKTLLQVMDGYNNPSDIKKYMLYRICKGNISEKK